MGYHIEEAFAYAKALFLLYSILQVLEIRNFILYLINTNNYLLRQTQQGQKAIQHSANDATTCARSILPILNSNLSCLYYQYINVAYF